MKTFFLGLLVIITFFSETVLANETARVFRVQSDVTDKIENSEDLLELGKESEGGSLSAKYKLAMHHLHGGNISEGMRLLKETAIQKYQPAFRMLAEIYFNGYFNQPFSKKETAVWVKKAFEAGDYETMYRFSDFFAGYKIYEDAIFWMEKVADKKYKDSKDKLAVLLKEKETQKQELKKLKEKAERGHVQSMVDLATIYTNLMRSKEDWKKGFDYSMKAADNGSEVGQFYVAECYRKGIHVEISKEKYIEWIKKAADNNNLLSQYYMGEYHYSRTEYDKAVEYFEKSAYQGYVPSQARLGKLYFDGEENWHLSEKQVNDMMRFHVKTGIRRDLDEAIFWLEEAAAHNDTVSMHYLGQLLFNGMLGENNKQKGLILLEKSMAAGNPLSAYYLAVIHEKGFIVKQDYNKAFICASNAITLGYDNTGIRAYKAKMQKILDDGKSLEKTEENTQDIIRESLALYSQKKYKEAFDLNLKEAEKGSYSAVEGLCFLANNVKLAEEDKEKFMVFLKNKAKKSVQAKMWLASFCKQGKFFDKDLKKAKKLFLEAVKEPVEEDAKKYKSLYVYQVGQKLKTVETTYPYPEYCHNIEGAMSLQNREGGEYLETETISYILEDKDPGHRQAMFQLAHLFFEENNIAEAVKWAKLSAKKHFKEAYILLGNIYANKGDMEKALEYYIHMAKDGNIPVQRNLVGIYANMKNQDEFIKWIILLAKKGDPKMQHTAGKMYNSPNVMKVDKNKAKFFLEAAARNGVVAAMTGLGGFYLENKDFKNARIWLKKAADNGDKKAEAVLKRLR